MVFTRVGFFNLFNFPGSCRRICLGVDKRSEVRPSRLLNKSHWRKHLGYSMFKASTSHEKLWFFSIECFFHPCHPKMFHTSGSCWRIGLGVDKRSEVKPQPLKGLKHSNTDSGLLPAKMKIFMKDKIWPFHASGASTVLITNPHDLLRKWFIYTARPNHI